MNWLIILILVLIALALLRAKEMKHRFGLIIIALLLLFLVVSMFQVYSSHAVDLTSFDGVVAAGKLYLQWLGTVFQSTKKVTSYAIQQEWGLSKNNESAEEEP